MTVEDLIAKFHNLEGITLSERTRSFNGLLTQLKTDLVSEENLKAFTSSLTPKNLLEDIFKIDILIHFQRNDELMEILKSGNPLWIRKVLKSCTFFEETFRSVDDQTLLNAILPHISFNTRMKVFNRLSKSLNNEEQADVYFKVIEEKYGLKAASAILPGCSLGLIKSVVEEYGIKFTSRQLLIIVRKHRTFLAFYFDAMRKANRKIDFSQDYKQVIKYIAKVDATLYWELFEKFDLNVKFGRHMTPYVLAAKEGVVIKDLLKIFNGKQVLKVTKKNEDDFRRFFTSYFPKNPDNFQSQCLYSHTPALQLIKNFPKNQRYAILNKYFAETYGSSLSEHPEYISEDIIKIMPVREREAILDQKVPDNENLIYLYPPKKSVPMLKNKIKHSQDRDARLNWCFQLLETCWVVTDNEALLGVLKYILQRHKNDIYIITEFMHKLIDWPNIHMLSQAHWDCINELLKVLAVGGKYCNREMKFMEKYLQYLMDNSMDIGEHIKVFLKQVRKDQYYSYYINVFDKLPKYQKICLTLFGMLIPQMFKGEEYVLMAHKFLSAVIMYNRSNPNDNINFSQYEEMTDTVKAKFLDTTVCYDNSENIIYYFIKHNYEKRGVYDSFLWDNHKILGNCEILKWYITTNPLKVLENIETLFRHNPNYNHTYNVSWSRRYRTSLIGLDSGVISGTVLKMLSKYSHLQIPEKLVALALQKLQDQDVSATYAINTLANLGTEEQYFDATNSLHFLSKTLKKILQKRIVNDLRYLKRPYTTLPELLKFCKPELIKSMQSSLYHIAFNTPQVMLAPFLITLSQSATLSAKKHALCLISAICTKEDIYNFLKQSGAAEEHESIRKVILKMTLKYFTENPSDKFWDLLKSNLSIFNREDREALDALLNLSKIPAVYYPQYIPLLYDLLSTSEDSILQNKKYGFLKSIPANFIGEMHEDFIKKIMEDTLFSGQAGEGGVWICLQYIFYTSEEKQSRIFALAFDILERYVQENRSGLVFGNVRGMVSDFLAEFSKYFINVDGDATLLDRFRHRWSTIFKPEEVPEEYLLLEFTAAYSGCDPKNKLSEFAHKVNEILLDYIGSYDPSVIGIFADVLHTFLDDFVKISEDDEKMSAFVENFCFKNQSRYTYIVITLLPCSYHAVKILKSTAYKAMLECQSADVKIYFNRYARSIYKGNTRSAYIVSSSVLSSRSSNIIIEPDVPAEG